MKKILFIVVCIAICLAAVCLAYSRNDEKQTETEARVADAQTANTQITNAQMTGTESGAALPEGVTERILPVDEETAVVFRNELQTGLKGERKILGTDEVLHWTKANTLKVLLRKNGTDEIINEITNTFTDNREWKSCDWPRVRDAAVSEDGTLLEFIVEGIGAITNGCDLFRYDLQKQNWKNAEGCPDNLEPDSYTGLMTRCPVFFCNLDEANFKAQKPTHLTGTVKEAYFITPDILRIKTTTGVDYAKKIVLKDYEFHKPNNKTVPIKDSLAVETYSWNGVGDPNHLSDIRDNAGYDFPESTEEAWKGWRRLEK